jgi:hypothetical protein
MRRQMNKALLIHHDNVPHTLLAAFADKNIVNFNYSDSAYNNLDEYISKEIIQGYLEDKSPDIIYIKDSLSVNYLELYGLRVAYHIRLSQEELQNKKFVPIVILSDLDVYTLTKLEPIAKIIFTKNIFLEANNKKAIEKFNNKIPQFLSENEYKNRFLNLIEVEPPENSTNHSIANEWAILQWASQLGLHKSGINKTKNRMSSMLSFKYLIQKYNLEEKKP